LSDAARETAEVNVNQDPLEVAGTYGTIFNKAVKRRAGRWPPPPMSSTVTPMLANASSLSSKPADVKDVKSLSTPNVKSKAKSSQSLKEIPSKGSQEKSNVSANPLQLKRDSSNIFKSFAKTKPPLKREGTDSSAGASGVDSAPPSGPEDEAMKDTSDGEEEDDYIPPPQASSKRPSDADRKLRKEREAALKKMMEDDEDENDESDIILENQHLESSKDSPASQLAEEAVQVSDGRRRGRRRVMKKKTIKDEEGYLGALKLFCIPSVFHDVILIYCVAVTREEPAWESFSEDEPAKTKPKPPSSLPPSSDKSKKGSSKAGQGSIMSFFGKK